MEKEISSGTMLGIVLIALAAVIGMGLGVFSIAKGTTNTGVVETTQVLEEVGNMDFGDYDQKIVTGILVRQAYKTFEGKPVGVLINTKAIEKGLGASKGSIVHKMQGRVYLNYNAVFSVSNSGDKSELGVVGIDGRLTVGKEGAISRDSGGVVEGKGYTIEEDGSVYYNTEISGLSRQGKAEYVDNNSKFDSELIRGSDGSIIGVMFTQI